MDHSGGGRSIASALLFASAPAVAQQTGEKPQVQDEGSGNDIIVTARRSEERLQDVPISITVLSQQDISKRNIVSSVDLGSFVPSLAVNTRFGPEKASFAIRGFTQETKTAPSVGVYFADVIAPRGNGSTGGGNGAGVGSLMDLQNVQVLKGPQGTLFGRNTTGGAILLVPQKPTDNLEGFVEGSLGDYDLRRVQGAANLPLSDTFRVRVAADYNRRDGYLKNHGLGPSRMGNTNYFASRISLVGDLTPNLENYTIASYSRSNTYGTAPRVQIAVPSGAFYSFAQAQVDRQNARGDGFWDVESNLANPQVLLEQWQVINTTTWRASDNLTIKNIASYGEFRERAAFSLSGDYFLVPAGPAKGQLLIPYIQIMPAGLRDNTSESTFTEEVQLLGQSSDGKFNWQAGAYLEISKPIGFSSTYAVILLNCTNPATFQCTNPIGAGSISNANYKDYFNNKGLYAQATYKLTDKLSITGGIRYTMDKMRTISQSQSISIPTPGTGVARCLNLLKFGNGIVTDQAQCNDPVSLNSKKPTWLLDVDFKPSDDVLLYAKWARGYRAGAINPNNIGFEVTQPEKVDTYEIGAKTSFHGAVPGYFSIAGFYNNFTNQQLAINAAPKPAFLGVLGGAQPIVNAGKSRIWGIEVDAAVTPFTGLKLDAGYTYLNTKLLQFNIPVSPFYDLFPTTTVGSPLSLSPRNRYTVSGTYTLPLSEEIGKISFGASFTHTDKNRAVSPAASPLFEVPAVNLLDLSANWNSVLNTPIDLGFFMTNATNQKIRLFPTTAGRSIGPDGGTLNLPRMLGLRMRYSFGE